MTYEHKIIVGLKEIKAVVFECKQCKARITLLPDDTRTPPAQCPRNHTWEWDVPEEYQTVQGSAFKFFLTALGKLRDPIVERAGFKIFLEFDGPKNAQ